MRAPRTRRDEPETTCVLAPWCPNEIGPKRCFTAPPPGNIGSRTRSETALHGTRDRPHRRDDLVSAIASREINVKGVLKEDGQATVKLQCMIYSDTPNLPNSPQASKAPRVLLSEELHVLISEVP